MRTAVLSARLKPLSLPDRVLWFVAEFLTDLLAGGK